MISTKYSLILVPNPRCASAALRVVLELAGERWLRYSQVKDEVVQSHGLGPWNACKKLVVVRRPLDRFLSACRFMWGWDRTQAEALPEEAAKIRELAFPIFVEWICGRINQNQAHPVFRRQVEYLAGEFDYVVAVHDLAQFFNFHQYGCLLHKNQSPKGMGIPGEKQVGKRERTLLLEAYAPDVKKFSNLLVWSPNQDMPRKLSGDCKSCRKRAERLKAKAAA